MTVPGIGPIIASAMMAAIGNGAAFAKGRDFAAWLGLVPRSRWQGSGSNQGNASGNVWRHPLRIDIWDITY
jgi:transposase